MLAFQDSWNCVPVHARRKISDSFIKKKKNRSKLPICLEFYCSSDSTLSFINHYLHFVATVGMHENRKVVHRGLIKVLINCFKVANEGEKEKTLGKKK